MPAAEEPRIIAIIPARFASTRFPGKMVAPLAGKPLVLHTYERTLQARRVDKTIIAADDQRILDALGPYGANVIMTSANHQTGTDRIAEVAAKETAGIIVNVQGDEPLIDPQCIDDAIQPLLDDPEVVMSTACRALTDPKHIENPNIVKVVRAQNGRALYFSRCPIPRIRDKANQSSAAPTHFQHIGLYAYRRDFLLQFPKLPQTPLEQLEKLEQLRVLEHGYTIAVIETEYEAVGVDAPEDLERVEAILNQNRVRKVNE